jgi:hypothetical protein
MFFGEAFVLLVCSLGVLMKAASGNLLIAALLAGCGQLIDPLYSKKNFNMQSFNADIAKCSQQSPSFVAMQSDAPAPKKSVDDAMVRECMKAATQFR